MTSKLKRMFLRKKIIITIIILILGLSAGLYGIQALNKPAEGVVNQDFNQPIAPYKQPSEILKEFKSTYFTSKYPSRYELQVNQNKSASLESWIVIAHQAIGQGPSSKIGISVTNLPNGGVKEDSAYKQFEAFKEIYTLTKETHNGKAVVVAERTDPNYEHTILWENSAYLLTASLTSGQKNSQLVSELNVILDNLMWAE